MRILFILFFPFFLSGQCKIDKSSWNLVFEDNFNGTINDLSSNWHFEHTDGPGNPYPLYSTSSNVSVSGGLLYLKTKKETTIYNGKTYTHTRGMLRSKLDEFPDCHSDNNTEPGGMLYGMFEVRCKLPDNYLGTYSAAWLTGNNAHPPEIDIFEFNGQQNDRFFTNIHSESLTNDIET